MLIKLSESHPIQPSEITPEAVYAERRCEDVMKAEGGTNVAR